MSAVVPHPRPLHGPWHRLGAVPSAVLGRTAVVTVWLIALALAGRPGWLAALVGLGLVAVWAAPCGAATITSRGGRGARTPDGTVGAGEGE